MCGAGSPHTSGDACHWLLPKPRPLAISYSFAIGCFSAVRTPLAAVHVGDLGVQDEAIPLENRNEPRLTGMRFNGKLDPPI